MDYECHVVPADKLLISPVGTQQPLCNDCRSPDCTNPIRDKIVSVMGINKKMRLWTVNNQVRMVVACKGYIGEQENVSMGSDEELGKERA